MEDIDEVRTMVEIHSHPRPREVMTRIPSGAEEKEGASAYLREQISGNPVILAQIFRHLAPSDLKSAALVSRTWRSLVEQPRYWRWAETRITRADFGQKFRSRRLRNIGSVRTDLSEVQIRKLFLSLSDWRLSSLAVSYINLSSVPAELLSSAIVCLQQVELCLCRLSPEQVRAVFSKVAERDDLPLRSLSINFTDLTSVPGPVLARALVRLTSVNLWLCRLSSAQVSALFTAIQQSSSSELALTRLTLNPSGLSSLPPSLFSAAVLRLQEVNFSYSDLSSQQLSQLFSEVLAAKQLGLRALQLNSTNLSSLPASLLAGAAVRLERLDLYNSCLTGQQVEAVLQSVLAQPSSLPLTNINMGGNELSAVPAELLAMASLRLGELRLADSQLTGEQVSAVFRAFLASGQENSRTNRCLHIGEKEVAAVPPEVLSEAQQKLQHCHLTNSWCLTG